MEKTLPDLQKALATKPKAKAAWKDLTPISRRDFTSWIESAKQAETRKRRVVVACSKLEAGERRPCCYSIVPMNMYKALGANPKAKAHWSKLSADEKRDFTDWVTAAKDSAAQKERVDKACKMLAAGKKR